MSSDLPFTAGDHFAWQQAQARPLGNGYAAESSFDPRPALRRSSLGHVSVGRRVRSIHRNKTFLGHHDDWRESYELFGRGWLIGTQTWYGYDERGRGAWEELRPTGVIDTSDALDTRSSWVDQFNMVSVKSSSDGYVILEDGSYKQDWQRLRQDVHRLVDESGQRR